MFDLELDLADVVFLEIREDGRRAGKFGGMRGSVNGVRDVDVVGDVAPLGDLSRETLLHGKYLSLAVVFVCICYHWVCSPFPRRTAVPPTINPRSNQHRCYAHRKTVLPSIQPMGSPLDTCTASS